LLTDPETVRREAKQVLEDYGRGTGHVFNLGHGVSQFTPPENVAALVETVHEVSVRYH
jgi:uroporphyrinogen decarboxylase